MLFEFHDEIDALYRELYMEVIKDSHKARLEKDITDGRATYLATRQFARQTTYAPHNSLQPPITAGQFGATILAGGRSDAESQLLNSIPARRPHHPPVAAADHPLRSPRRRPQPALLARMLAERPRRARTAAATTATTTTAAASASAAAKEAPRRVAGTTSNVGMRRRGMGRRWSETAGGGGEDLGLRVLAVGT
jgi:hypothetical protein